MFDLIVLGTGKVFLSRARRASALDTAKLVAELLNKPVVETISIKRVIPKDTKREAGDGQPRATAPGV